MDYRDYEAGATKDYFYFKAKGELMGTLLAKTGKEKDRKILEVGAGTGDDIESVARLGEVYVLDINSDALDLIPDELVIEKKCCDVNKIPYPANYFDLVLLFDVLEHVEDDKKVMKEIRRVLRDGGHLILTVPAFNILYSTHDKALGHIRRYNMREVAEKLSMLNKQETGYWVSLFFAPIAITRLVSRILSTGENAKPHLMRLPGPVNEVLYRLLRFENWLIGRGVRLPLGLTIYGIYQKRRKPRRH